jgi:hypothetical protein
MLFTIFKLPFFLFLVLKILIPDQDPDSAKHRIRIRILGPPKIVFYIMCRDEKPLVYTVGILEIPQLNITCTVYYFDFECTPFLFSPLDSSTYTSKLLKLHIYSQNQDL